MMTDVNAALNAVVNDVGYYRLFVYGTLMRGLGNHHRLHRHGASYMGDGRLDGALVNFHGAFPGFVGEYSAEAAPIVGELYAVTHKTLEDLDRLEGQLYRKAIVEIDRGGWRQLACTYQLRDTYAQEERTRVQPLDGVLDWRQSSRICIEQTCHDCPPWGE
jgi:gamma-glutamylcyclotransferase (GGCT)/AIG2-like uncharacterized protein YtfP